MVNETVMMPPEARIPITDDYMFGYVMRQPGICAKVLSCLLPQVHVDHVRFKDENAETQKSISGNLGSHSVRLDVYLDDGKTVFNVEMQTGNKSNLPKRVRYYGGRIDCDQLARTQDYNELRPTYVIFICTFDPFGKKQVRYSFENTCSEVNNLKLQDESYKIFFNVTGKTGDVSPELKALLDYFHHPERLPENEETELTRELDSFVDFANHDDDWRRDYMTYVQAQMDARNAGRNEGIALGRTQGIAIGERKGMVRILRKLVNQGILSAGEASVQAGMSEKDFMALLAEES